MNNKILKLTAKEASIHRTHLPNEMHRDACLRGTKIFKSKKTYTRKNKHKKSYQSW